MTYFLNGTLIESSNTDFTYWKHEQKDLVHLDIIFTPLDVWRLDAVVLLLHSLLSF